MTPVGEVLAPDGEVLAPDGKVLAPDGDVLTPGWQGVANIVFPNERISEYIHRV